MREIRWRGIHKLTEECGEVLQLLGKVGVFPGGDHPDGKGPLGERLAAELSDLRAAIDYFVSENCDLFHMTQSEMRARTSHKFGLFKRWNLSGIAYDGQEAGVSAPDANTVSTAKEVRKGPVADEGSRRSVPDSGSAGPSWMRS